MNEVTLARLIREAGADEGDPWPAARELAASGDRTLVPAVAAALEQFLVEQNSEGRDVMAVLLAGLRGAGAVPLLLDACARPAELDDADTLRGALASAVRADPAAARPTIVEFLAAGDAQRRSAAVWALGCLPEPGDLDLLEVALADPSWRVRMDALSSLPTLSSSPRAFDLAVGGLRDPDGWVRRTAVLVLAWCDIPAAADRLIPLAGDPEPQVRSALGEAIARLADETRRPAAATMLRTLSEDQQPTVRAGAARGLDLLRFRDASR